MSGSEQTEAKTYDFQAELAAVLDVELSPEVLHSYAENAINGVIAVATGATEAYEQTQLVDPTLEGKDLEDKAFEHFGLKSVENVLGFLVMKSDEIKALSAFVASLPVSDEIITPTDVGSLELNLSDGKHLFPPRETMPRLESILFVLQNDFGIDVFDNGHVVIKRGGVESTSVRRHGYDFIHIPGIDRAVLSCDEVDNATFVFSTSQLFEQGVDLDQLRAMKKSEITAIIDACPAAGQKLPYTKNYVARVAQALRTIVEAPDATTDTIRGNHYLYPIANDTVESAHKIAKQLHIGAEVVATAIKNAGGSLGYVVNYRYGSHYVFPGYDERQRWILLGELEKLNAFTPLRTEQVESVNEMVRALKLSPLTIRKAIESVGDEMGEVHVYKFGPQTTEGYDERQRWLILDELVKRESFAPPRPEGFVSERGLRDALGAKGPEIKKALIACSEELGVLTRYKFGGIVTEGYGPREQSIIKRFLGKA